MAARIRAAADTRRKRLATAARILAATAGGYLVAALAAIALGAALPVDPATATIAATLIGLAAMPVAAMACIRARSAGRAWAGTTIVVVACAAIALYAGWRP